MYPVMSTDNADETNELTIMRDRRAGYSLIESLEKCGLMLTESESRSEPWEIDEFLMPNRKANPRFAPLTPKKYIGDEIQRNKSSAHLFAAMVRIAFGKDDPVMVGHHIGFEIGNDLDTENEIPSADTLIFDHDIMGAVFGDKAIETMQALAAIPVAKRDAELLRRFLAIHSL